MPGFEVIGAEEKEEVLDALSRNMLFRYEFDEQRKGIYKVAEFEREFAKYCGVNHALAVSSGTAALKVAMAALGIGPGDEVITQGFTFIATWEAIFDTGAIPVFAEIDDTLCLDPGDIENKISPRTRAIIPVHMCGAQARIKEIVSIADSHGIPVIEDTAQACGGRFEGKALGSFGKMGTFSFDSVKTITTGEGGMVITNDKDLNILASEYHDHGHDHNPDVGRGLEKRNFIGFNYRMMELQGALGLAQLRKLDNTILKRQRENKSRIKEALSGIEQVTFRTIPDPDGDTATFLIFLLPTPEMAKEFNGVMTEEGFGTVYWYENDWHYFVRWEHLLEGKSIITSDYPFKTESGDARCGYEKSSLPKTAELLSRALTIPIAINMDEQIPGIINAIEKAGRTI
ncbi:DegT/DnrJ/EryC1/StrS family aminotransferase [Thermodesulfobacteriota bacterium]